MKKYEFISTVFGSGIAASMQKNEERNKKEKEEAEWEAIEKESKRLDAELDLWFTDNH